MSTSNVISSDLVTSDNPSAVPHVSKRERWEKLAALLADDVPVCEALIQAGFSKATAKRGWESVPKRVSALLLARGIKHERVGDALMKQPEKLEKRIVGKMYAEMMEGEKMVPVSAAKALMQHRSVASQFVQEQQNNVVVIQAPADWKPKVLPANDNKPALPPSQAKLPDYE